MSKKNERVALSDAELASKIDRLVAIRPMANEYRALCDAVRDELLTRPTSEFATAGGNKAKVKLKRVYAWLVEKLKKALARGVFEAVCPRKADARKLNQRMAAMPEDKKLAACRVEMTPKHELEVLAAGENELANQDEENDAAEAA